MGFRLKLGRYLSIGPTGLRFHLTSHGVTASTGRTGWRIYARKGPLYWNRSGR